MGIGLISVDQWTHGSQVYFLMHLHSDNTQRLTSAWDKGPLFCSCITTKLLPFKFTGLKLSLLRILDVGTWHFMSMVSPSSGEKTVVGVMAIDAHHCPEFGCLLYIGDFRCDTSTDRAWVGRTKLVKALKDDVVDILYLDNTYGNPSYVFPSRRVAAQQIEEFIKLVQPRSIKGIVSSSSCYVEPIYYFGRLCVTNQPSLKLRLKKDRRLGMERVVVVHEKSLGGSGDSTKVERKRRRTLTVGLVGLHSSKVNALRRVGRGAKLAEMT